jgi:hypothetical protein
MNWILFTILRYFMTLHQLLGLCSVDLLFMVYVTTLLVAHTMHHRTVRRKKCVKKLPWPTFNLLSRNLLQGAEIEHDNRDFNPGPPESDADASGREIKEVCGRRSVAIWCRGFEVALSMVVCPRHSMLSHEDRGFAVELGESQRLYKYEF